MKIYLAARYSRHPEMRAIRDEIHRLGHIVTSRWIDHHGGDLLESIVSEQLNAAPAECTQYAKTDLADLIAADMVISFTSADGGGKGGRHWELGFAYGLGRKRLIVVGPREHIFHTLIDEIWPDWPAAREAIFG